MNKSFSIYESPFSEDTKKTRRNVLIASCVCIFIGMTNQLPSSFSLWGATFDSNQQTIVGWLLFSVTLYLYLHFLAVAGLEVAKWIRPFYEGVVTKNKLQKHAAFDETDWLELFEEDNMDELEYIKQMAKEEAKFHVQKKLRYLYGLVYLQLTIELLVPVLLGAFGLIKLVILINE